MSDFTRARRSPSRLDRDLDARHLPFTAQDVLENLEARDLENGLAYCRQGRVVTLDVRDGGRHLEALVQGSRRAPYRVSIDILPGRHGALIEGDCSCPV